MGLFGPQLQWQAPWSRAWAKSSLLELKREMPSLWRMIAYCVVIPVAACVAVRLWLPETAETLTWGRIALTPIGCTALFVVMPIVIAICPRAITLRKNGICFSQGNSVFFIKAEQIQSLCFHLEGEELFFVVRATTKRGVPFERRIAMPRDKVSEQDVIRFLYDMELSHLLSRTAEQEQSAPSHPSS